jgi:ABC-type transport system involved in multi-copper enzyme maturation permease subunit
MLWAVLKKELIENFTSFRFWAGFSATLAIAVVVSWAGGEDYRLRRARGEEQREGYGRELQVARTYSQVQPTVVRAPEPLSILEPGFDSRLGVEVRIVPFRIPFEATEPSHGNELMAAASEVGLTALVGLVLGFFTLLLTFDSFARERESGSLRLLEVQGLTPGKILLGKYLAGILAVSLPLAGAVALATERLLDVCAGALTGDQWLRVGCFFLACLGYLSCSTLWGLAFSLRAPTRAAALTRAVEAWLLTILILPVVAGNSAHDLLRYEESRRQIDEQMRSLEEERDALIQGLPWMKTFTAHSPMLISTSWEKAFLLRLGSARYYDRTSHCFAHAARINGLYAEKIADLERRRETPLPGERFLAGLSAVSPRLLLDRLAQALAGTSHADHLRFLSDCRNYQRNVVGHLERVGAFGSWRWFTDDLPGATHPWPLFLGLSPDEVEIGKEKKIALALGRPDINERVQRYHKESDADSARNLDLTGLPEFSQRKPALSIRLGETSGAAAALLLFHLGALGFAWRGLRPGAAP